MNTKTITIRELTHNMKKITAAVQRGSNFTVLKNAKPVFEIRPIANDATHGNARKLTLDDLKKHMFVSKVKDPSKKIDEIVYGV